MSKPLIPYDRWTSGTNENSIPANDNSLRSEILGSSAISDAVTAEPSLSSPDDDGKWYVIPAGATGAQWAAFAESSCAIFYGGTWYEFTPVQGVIVVIDSDLYVYDGGAWVEIAGGGGGASWGSITGTLASQADLQAALDEKGAAGIPQNSQSTAYTLVLGDANKHILHPSADTTARVFTIPANSSVAFPVGTAVTFVNQNAAGVITIAITTDTMRLAGAGTTGSRTLAANGIATALKVTSTEWIIAGTGLT